MSIVEFFIRFKCILVFSFNSLTFFEEKIKFYFEIHMKGFSDNCHHFKYERTIYASYKFLKSIPSSHQFISRDFFTFYEQLPKNLNVNTAAKQRQSKWNKYEMMLENCFRLSRRILIKGCFMNVCRNLLAIWERRRRKFHFCSNFSAKNLIETRQEIFPQQTHISFACLGTVRDESF